MVLIQYHCDTRGHRDRDRMVAGSPLRFESRAWDSSTRFHTGTIALCDPDFKSLAAVRWFSSDPPFPSPKKLTAPRYN